MGDERQTRPPFDGKPCPMCPVEIRNLAAVAHNLLSQLDRGASLCTVQATLSSLRGAVKMVEPYGEAHFADPAHCYGASTALSPRPGTRMLDLDASSSDPIRQAAESTIPAAEKARRYRHKLVDLLGKAEAALRPGAGRAELAALADEAHTVRTQLDVEERCEARRQAVAPNSGAIGAPQGSKERVLPESEN